MAKTKKEVLLGGNVAQNLIQSGQWQKLYSMVEEKRFTPEAIRIILDARGVECNLQDVMRNYNFEDVYSSFEDYISSKLARDLKNEGDCEVCFGWFSDFPSSSEELLELYNKQATSDDKTLLYKNVVYRTRSFKLNQKVRDNYLQCFDAILEITRKEYNNDLVESLNYIATWASYVSEAWGHKIAELVGTSQAISMMTKRTSMRIDYFYGVNGAVDLKEICKFLYAVIDNPTVDNMPTAMAIVEACSPFNWEYRMEKVVQEEAFETTRDLYTDFLKPLILSDFSLFCKKIVSCKCARVASVVYTFEEDEELVNTFFSLASKSGGVSHAIDNIINLNNRGFKITVTELMKKTSELCSNSWDSIILTTPLTTAKEVIEYKNRVFPFDHYITSCADNKFATDNFNLGAFDNADVEALSKYLDWNNISKYFKSGMVPFSFLSNHKDKIVGTISITGRMIESYSTSQLIALIDEFSDKIDRYVIPQIITILLLKKKGVTEAEAARLLRASSYIELSYGNNETANSKLDLQSVLTLI